MPVRLGSVGFYPADLSAQFGGGVHLCALRSHTLGMLLREQLYVCLLCRQVALHTHTHTQYICIYIYISCASGVKICTCGLAKQVNWVPTCMRSRRVSVSRSACFWSAACSSSFVSICTFVRVNRYLYVCTRKHRVSPSRSGRRPAPPASASVFVLLY